MSCSIHGTGIFWIFLFWLGLASCQETEVDHEKVESLPDESGDVLFRVGSILIREVDLDHFLRDRYGNRKDNETRKEALNKLVVRAQVAQEALDTGLDGDPIIVSESHRLLGARLREIVLQPKLKSSLEVSEGRLRELYKSQMSRFQSPETRKVAVLWLDSGPDPDRIRRCEQRLKLARRYMFENRDILDQPEKGFSILGADYSEHSASRFRGGILGWLSETGNLDPWSNAVGEIAFEIEEKGEVSQIISRKEGVFLVRLMDLRPAVTRSFESVANSLKKEEQARLRMEVEEKFYGDLRSRHPVFWNRR